MRIDALNKIGQVYGANGRLKVNHTAKTSSSDKVEISTFGKDLQVARQAVSNAPDVREDKVAEYKSRIQAGTYDVSSESFADKMLEEYR
ncbi:MAG: flagellar biosynthesis anti-sigma factor FlgM [Lachnospiraceae bacterium]|nr:flagellar biosynthesis anti-sigma factor FlgM [Lachnospiraceae bacterium]